jgi:hypothetical protein
MGHVAAAESANRKLPRVAGRARQALSLKRELIRPQNDAIAILRQPMILKKISSATEHSAHARNGAGDFAKLLSRFVAGEIVRLGDIVRKGDLAGSE